ncbi:glycosyltransferase [Sphingomonas sp. BK069]|uniref:glycosyltransferase n=1 Tax=Sphingomonas sp. BK069 TaxID=2586979 RepID=UPI00161BE127|nr:glycosyltransferase [Sphingomonas sp. BK069]MBB3349628.1 glycosyltransferase involved in cell wall biosynthesis [Sphingomonas sp. BK069]
MIRVVMCAHNGAHFLEAQLASIMEQQLPVDQIHVFDFASTDATRSLLAGLAPRWPRLDVQLVDHAPGVTLSFRHALANIVPRCADDDLVFLSDQDDVWLPQKTARMAARVAAARRGVDDRILAFHDVILCDAELRELRPSFYDGRPFRLPRDLEPARLMIASPVIGHTIAATPALLALMLEHQRLEHYVMHDWALVLLATHLGRVEFEPERLGLYRQHDSNVLGAGRRRSAIGYVRRAATLSRAVNVQARAFLADLPVAAAAVNERTDRSPLPGRGPLAWRLGVAMATHGPTIWHRALGLTQLRYLVPFRRDAGARDGS